MIFSLRYHQNLVFLGTSFRTFWLFSLNMVLKTVLCRTIFGRYSLSSSFSTKATKFFYFWNKKIMLHKKTICMHPLVSSNNNIVCFCNSSLMPVAIKSDEDLKPAGSRLVFHKTLFLFLCWFFLSWSIASIGINTLHWSQCMFNCKFVLDIDLSCCTKLYNLMKISS